MRTTQEKHHPFTLHTEDPKPSVMIFDMDVEGHHASYIRYVVDYWIQQNKDSDLLIIVTPKFIELHEGLVNFSVRESQGKVQFISISNEEIENLEFNRRRSILSRAFTEWKLFCTYAKSLNIKHGVLMYFDYFQIPLIFGQRSPCSVSGIYFRPALHYDSLFPSKSTFKEKLKNFLKKNILKLALKQSQFNILFCLDQFSIDYIRRLNPKAHIQYLPDPINLHQVDPQEVDRLKEKLKIEDNRHVFLLFGSLDKRKGIYKVLEAIQQFDFQTAQSICLLFVGRLSSSDRELFKNTVAMVSGSSNVQIIIRDEFIDDDEIQAYFEITDIVLIPYQRHVGMSGILLHAATTRKTMIVSNYGLLGKLVEIYDLGINIDSDCSIDLMKAMKSCLHKTEYREINANLREQFIKEHSVEIFQHTLCQYLG